MGIVTEKGPGVKDLKVGDRVVMAFDIACGECEHCQKQQFTGCETTNDSKLADKVYGHAPAALFGYSRLLGNVPGSQAEYVRVPFADVNCCKVPEDVPDEKALYVSDVLCTSLHAAELGEVKEGDTVAIWGLGPIGLCTARWCQIKKARRIIAIDLVSDRLALAQRALGIEVIDRTGMTSQQLINKLLELEPKGFDVTIEAVGFRFPVSTVHKIARTVGLETDTPEIIDECLTTLKPYGHVSIIGDYAGYCHGFPIGKIMFKHATVRSGQCPCQKYFDYVMKCLQDGTFDPTFMITHRISLEDIPKAYEKLDKKEDGYIKVFVRP
jgi:threonine dehydrogenase-like Zn-dependent dehydrogenase